VQLDLTAPSRMKKIFSVRGKGTNEWEAAAAQEVSISSMTGLTRGLLETHRELQLRRR